MVYRVHRAPLGDRMARSARCAGFTIKDLSVWLDRPYRRVQAWYSRSVAPRDPDYDRVLERLTLLAFAVRNKKLVKVRGKRTALCREKREQEIRRAYRASRRDYLASGYSAK